MNHMMNDNDINYEISPPLYSLEEYVLHACKWVHLH